MRRVWILVPAVLVLAACGGRSGAPKGPPLATISLSEREFAITPDTTRLPRRGVYRLRVANRGQITHALVVAGNGVDATTGDIAPGGSATLEVDLAKDGTYELYCPIDGHRSKGMQASVAVGG
jgi:plastocyanin